MSSTINVAKDFSRYPAGRYKDDGPNSGERFRDDFLKPVLDSDESAIIELDGVRGYGSSFLEEAFGGLVRQGYGLDVVMNAFTFVTEDESLVDEIKEYIAHGAEPNM